MNHHPLWSHSLAERLSMLRPGTVRIAYLYPKPDFGTFRYRCFNPVQALAAHNTDISAAYFFYSDLKIVEDLSDFADVLVAVRTPFDARIDQLFRRFTNQGKRVLFDIDDLVFDTRFAPLVASNLGYLLEEEELNQWTAFIANIGIAMSRTSGVTTTNQFLVSRISEHVDVPVHVIPNTFNIAQREASDALAQKKPREGQGLRIGYFSGSHSHSQDFDIAAGALSHYLGEFSDASLLIAGHLEIPPALEPYHRRISRLPFMDFVEMQKVLHSVDLNIVPLQDSPFTHSKSDLKFFEAALVETPTLASRGPVFAHAISPGVTGFLASRVEWEDALSLIHNLPAEELSEMGNRARSYALEHYSPQALVDSLTHVFGKEL